MRYGGEAMMKKKAKIVEPYLAIEKEDVVIIGSPIWNDRLSTPINTVLDKISFNKETTKFIVYPAGESAKKVFEQIKKLGFKNEPFVYSYPLKNQDKVQEIINYLGE